MNKILILIFFLSSGYAQKEYLSLADCIQIALTNKEALKASALDVESSRQSIRGSYSNILPYLTLSGSVTESSRGSNLTGFEAIQDSISSQNSSSARVSLSQNIYDGGKWWNSIAQSKTNYKIAEQFNRQVKINIIREVHRNYFNY